MAAGTVQCPANSTTGGVTAIEFELRNFIERARSGLDCLQDCIARHQRRFGEVTSLACAHGPVRF